MWLEKYPEELAKCGLYYLNERDRVKCIYYGLIIRDRKLGDKASFSLKCSFKQYMSLNQTRIENTIWETFLKVVTYNNT